MQLPRISTNLAISADGKIAPPDRTPSGWTSHEDHQRLLALRQDADALLVGRATLIADRMRMLTPGRDVQPHRCIVSRNGEIPQDHPIFETEGGPIHLLVSESPADPSLPVTFHRGELRDFLATLATEHGVNHLHCEGGGELIRMLAEIDVIDEFHLTLAGHTVFGGAMSPTATGVPRDFLPASRTFELAHFEPRPDLGECFLSYRRLREDRT